MGRGAIKSILFHPVRRSNASQSALARHFNELNENELERDEDEDHENDQDNDGPRPARKPKTNLVLCHEYWKGQEHESSDQTIVHSRHLRTLCEKISTGALDPCS